MSKRKRRGGPVRSVSTPIRMRRCAEGHRTSRLVDSRGEQFDWCSTCEVIVEPKGKTMKQWLAVGAVVGMLVCGGSAEASVRDSLKNVWSYVKSPVNCAGNLVHDVGADLVKFTWCLVGNINRNPVSLAPAVETEETHTVTVTPHEHE